MTSGGLDNEAMRGLAISLTGAAGDLNSAPIHGIHLGYTTGGGSNQDRGINIASGWTHGIFSASPIETDTDANVIVGGRLAVGSGTPTVATATGDAYVTGKLEIDGKSVLGVVFVNGGTSSTIDINGETTTHSRIQASTTWDHLGIFVGSSHGRTLVIGERAVSGKNYDHGIQTHPFVPVHSALDPDTDNGEFLGINYLGVTAGTMETDRATYDFTLKASSAWASAVTNVDGGKLILEGGTGKTATDGGIVQVGSGFSTSHSLDSEKDIGFEGEVEFDSAVWFDSTVSHTPPNPTAPFDAHTITMTSGGLSAEAMKAIVISMTGDSGDLSSAPIVGVDLSYTTGGGSNEPVALNVGAGWDYGLKTASPIQILDDMSIDIGSLPDASFRWSTAQTNDSLVLGLGATSNTLIVVSSAWVTSDFDKPNRTDPGIFVTSALNPGTDNGEWSVLGYNELSAGTMETDRAAYDFTIKASNAYSGASTNVDGGKLILEGGTGKTATDGGIVQVGSGFSSNHSLDSEKDLGVVGEVEVSQNMYIEGSSGLEIAQGVLSLPDDACVITIGSTNASTISFQAGAVRVQSVSTIAKEALEIDQQDADQEFVYWNGTASNPSAGSSPADNLTEINGSGAVVGPQTTSGSPDTGWAFNGMIKVKVDAEGGGTADVWIPNYTVVTS
jgi:hypothetical protein